MDVVGDASMKDVLLFGTLVGKDAGIGTKPCFRLAHLPVHSLESGNQCDCDCDIGV